MAGMHPQCPLEHLSRSRCLTIAVQQLPEIRRRVGVSRVELQGALERRQCIRAPARTLEGDTKVVVCHGITWQHRYRHLQVFYGVGRSPDLDQRVPEIVSNLGILRSRSDKLF